MSRESGDLAIPETLGVRLEGIDARRSIFRRM
jgi:hypothetical protein